MRPLRSTHGPLIGTIWDPSPAAQYHVDLLEVLEGSAELPRGLAAVSVRLEPGGEAGSDSVEVRVNE